MKSKPALRNVTLFGKRVVANVIHLNEEFEVGPNQGRLCPIEKEHLDTDLHTAIMSCGDKGRDWGDEYKSQEMPKTASKAPEARGTGQTPPACPQRGPALPAT